MVRAFDRTLGVAPCLGVADPAAAMPADVVEAVQLAVLAADDEDALADDVNREEIAGFRCVIGAPGVVPLAEEDLLPLQLEDVGRVVVAPRKSRATRARHARYVTTGTLLSPSEA